MWRGAASLHKGLDLSDPGQGLRPLAEKIASGDLSALESHAALPVGAARPQELLQGALASSFGWVTAYGAVSAFALALASLLVFAPARQGWQAPACCTGPCSARARTPAPPQRSQHSVQRQHHQHEPRQHGRYEGDEGDYALAKPMADIA